MTEEKKWPPEGEGWAYIQPSFWNGPRPGDVFAELVSQHGAAAVLRALEEGAEGLMRLKPRTDDH
jgi:hypothetical protein